ncbi:MAG TPA: glycosyltransferase family 4 protein [Chitinophagaceae bacterium]|nr:glycosyltransferase family 4 protein [Chitinophagaceae bacterium]
MTYKQAKRKFRVEYLLMLPFVLAGRLYGALFPLKTRHDLFLFFPNGDIGGSPQVNIDLTHCLRDKKPLILFSKKPKNNGFREMFNIEGVRIIDLHRLIDRKIFHFVNFFYRGVIAAWINRSDSPVMIGGESLFFYKLLQHVSKRTRRIEICHLDTWLPYSIGHIDNIDERVFSTAYLKKQVEQQYAENNLAEKYYKHLHFIDNSIPIPGEMQSNNKVLEVVFIGRGAPQKRVHLVAAIAEKMHRDDAPVSFSFIGDVEKIISPASYPYCRFYGNISNQSQLETIYAGADVLILTSAFEGLPVVVMKMMAYGKAVVSTAVNGIPDYIKHNENGLLIYASEEAEIVEEGSRHLKLLASNPDLLKEFGRNNRIAAIQKFSAAHFCQSYRQLIYPEPSLACCDEG